MSDLEKVVKGLECCAKWMGKDDIDACNSCPYHKNFNYDDHGCLVEVNNDAIFLLKEQEKEIKALRLLVKWAEECDFGFDQFQDEYEQYKDELKDMNYIDEMIHIAKRTLEDNGAFEEGR